MSDDTPPMVKTGQVTEGHSPCELTGGTCDDTSGPVAVNKSAAEGRDLRTESDLNIPLD